VVSVAPRLCGSTSGDDWTRRPPVTGRGSALLTVLRLSAVEQLGGTSPTTVYGGLTSPQPSGYPQANGYPQAPNRLKLPFSKTGLRSNYGVEVGGPRRMIGAGPVRRYYRRTLGAIGLMGFGYAPPDGPPWT